MASYMQSSLIAPYPWWQSAFNSFLKAFIEQKLPQAVMIEGAKASGKMDLALTLAKILLCERPNLTMAPGYCDNCHSCRLVNANTHLDLKILDFNEVSSQLTVDEARSLASFLQLSATRGGAKVAIVNHADKLNAAAANALLKILEEPPTNSYIYLLVEEANLLPLTLRSRLVRFHLEPVTLANLTNWLKVPSEDQTKLELAHHLLGSSILQIKEALENPAFFEARAQFKRYLQLGVEDDLERAAMNLLETHDLKTLLEIWLSVAQDVLKGALKLGSYFNMDLTSEIKDLSQKAKLTKLLALIDWLQETIRQLVFNLNAPLVVESLLFKWQQLFKN